MTPEEQITLDLFEAVESRPDINQRHLSGTCECVSEDDSEQRMDPCTQGQGTSLVILSHSPGKFGEKPTHPELPSTYA